MAIANVALTDTFDTWRIRTNQLIVLYEQSNNQISSAFSGVPASFGHANAAFDRANAANVLAFNALPQTGGTITGNLIITGNVTVSSNTTLSGNVGVLGNSTFSGNTNFTSNTNFSGHTISLTANVASQVLTDASTINWNLSNGSVAFVTLGGNRTLANPTNMRVGSYILHVIQDVSGNRTLSFGSSYKWPAGVAPDVSTTASSRDIFSFVCDGINMYGSFLPDVK